MPKLFRPPKLCFRKSNGTYHVNWQGKQLYMGKMPEARQNYLKFVKKWSAAGSVSTIVNDEKCCVPHLMAAFITSFKERASYSVSDLYKFQWIASMLFDQFGMLPVNEFSPHCLIQFRENMITAGYERDGKQKKYTRSYVNKTVNQIRTVFNWGVEREIVDPMVHLAMTRVKPLRIGIENNVIERKKRPVVSANDVNITLAYLSTFYRDIVSLLRLTIMRPVEICRIREVDIEKKSDSVWVYRPSKHKTKWRGIEKEIAIGPKAIEILKRRMKDKNETERLFPPIDSCIESNKIGESNNNIKRIFNDQLQTNNISKAVAKAINIARKHGETVADWTPYDLRRSGITFIAYEEGEIAAQRLAGHSSLRTTEIYNRAALDEAIRVAKKYG